MGQNSYVTFNAGQLYRRRELHKQFGGQRQGGISTPQKFPFILLVTGDSGKRHGYSDEWTDEGTFLYTGEGQRGDMEFRGGNRAIRDHAANGKALLRRRSDFFRTAYVLFRTRRASSRGLFRCVAWAM